MKLFIGALALALAVPAAAQTAPAAPVQSGHHRQGHGDLGQHGGAHHDHSKMMECCKEGERKDCCKDGKADCCDKMKQQDAAAPASSGQAHEGHDH